MKEKPMSPHSKKYPSIRVFQNPILERLTHVHPITPALVWIPVVLFCLYRALVVQELSVLSVLGLGFVALLFWTFTEYFLHRYVFHLPVRGPISERFQFLVHGLHHDDPQDPTRLVMPPAAGAILGILFYSLFYLVLGPRLVDAFFAFFIAGYLCYDYTHYYVHHFHPTSFVGKWIKQSHMIHHYVDQGSRWGVSSPLWDWVFGTFKPSVGLAADKISAIKVGSKI